VDNFFEVYQAASGPYNLSRRVYQDFDGAEIRIYSDDKLIIKVEGDYNEVEEIYQRAADRLSEWVKQREH
jgi:hypothetical protein